MSYPAKAYAKAFVLAMNAGGKAREGTLIANLIKSANRHGDGRLLPKIAEEVEALTAKQAGGQVVLMESARVLGAHAKKGLMRHFLKKDIVREKIRPELIAGVRININGEKELDRSFKGIIERMLG